MGKNKLSKFDDMEGYPNVLQYPFGRLEAEGFALKGFWSSRFFGNSHPVVVELGCGKGEYTLELGRRFPDINFIGVDIKGARLWSGAKASNDEGLTNVAFLRTHVELITRFFAGGEVSEIWLTFPDPQMKKSNRRLTSPRFMSMYRCILTDGGLIHLKTDSGFMYGYTLSLARANGITVVRDIDDIYGAGMIDGADTLSIRTYYEQQWLERGMTIKYLSLLRPETDALVEPDVTISPDAYRSFGRNRRLEATPRAGYQHSNLQ
ncbi:MAG: tRNA (guanosine(46)-N7)-methyltransferase TrmB [Tannerellaceae bacterium]|nr:tRNA (guanosine(46)-N7)-methyltransferase TrmB [Tannerellaceae bacterium]